ncbi:serine/threonine-protein kinase [Streptomyces sp. NPDC058467]|uniref:serine/threonine-protein kinase n=1 Tax=Streptomyces sp. NPDC058467 TaxID=3346513 RepID=UPI00365595D7
MVQEMGPGRTLAGRYRIRNRVGSGGLGSVWTAYDEALRVDVTVEAVGAAGPERMARVARTLRGAAQLPDHPNVIPLYDIVETDGVLWTVMPLVSGPSLADHLAEHGRMSGERVREVADPVLGALEAMHRAGLVHGDVRPANVRFDGGRWVLLPGIGALARATELETTRDDEGWISEANYIAPERLHGAPREPSSDLFSLGATLYHLVAGHAPFHRDSLMATLSAVALEEPPPLGGIGELGRLIEGLLEKDPERRLTVAEAQRMLYGATGEAHAEPAARTAGPAPVAMRRLSANHAVGAASWGLLSAVLVVALTLAGAHLTTADVSDTFATLLPWALFALGLCVLAVQARAALTRRRNHERVPVWRWYVGSLAPPAPWTEEERDRRRAAAERAVDEALLTVDRRLAAASPGKGGGRGTTDV